MGALDRVVQFVDHIGRILITAGVAIIACVMVAQVFFRYVLNSSLEWSEELCIYTLMYIVFIGAFMLVRNWEHISITVFVNMLPFKWKAITLIVAKFFCALFIIIGIYYGFEMVVQAAHRNSPSMGFSTRWVKFSIPLGISMMTIFIVNEIIRDILAYRRRDVLYFDRLGEGGTL